MAQAIKKLCREEYNLGVKVYETSQTVWIYTAFDCLTDEKGFLDKTCEGKIGDIFLSLERIFLSIDKPPEFYAFCASGTEKLGSDFMVIGFIPDIKKFKTYFISRGELFQRRLLSFEVNPLALGDKEGTHINKYNLTLPIFISLLIEEKIKNSFYPKNTASESYLKTCRVFYDSQRKAFYVKICVNAKEDGAKLSNSLNTAAKICSYFICEVYDFSDFAYLKIDDFTSGKSRVFNKKALQEIKLKPEIALSP